MHTHVLGYSSMLKLFCFRHIQVCFHFNTHFPVQTCGSTFAASLLTVNDFYLVIECVWSAIQKNKSCICILGKGTGLQLKCDFLSDFLPQGNKRGLDWKLLSGLLGGSRHIFYPALCSHVCQDPPWLCFSAQCKCTVGSWELQGCYGWGGAQEWLLHGLCPQIWFRLNLLSACKYWTCNRQKNKTFERRHNVLLGNLFLYPGWVQERTDAVSCHHLFKQI